MTPADCVLITDDHLPHIGGSRLWAHRVASLLAGRLAVVTRYRPGCADFDKRVPYPVSRLHLRGKAAGGPAIIGEVSSGLELARGALAASVGASCFLAGEVMPAAFAARLAAGRTHVPYGVVLHDEPLSGAGPFERRLRRWVLRRAACIVVSSSFPQTRAREIVDESRPIFVAPPGVDADRFSPGPPDESILKRFGVAPETYLLCVGRLVDYKNVQAVLRAVAKPPGDALTLVVVGEGPYRPALERLAADLGLGRRAVFTRRIDTKSLVALYRGAFAYVFPSTSVSGAQHEGIGMAALEAAACGCSVIASTDTSACDFIRHGETGLIFSPRQPSALAASINTLLLSPQARKRMAARSAANVRQKFTWQRAAATLSDAIDYMKNPPPRQDASSCAG